MGSSYFGEPNMQGNERSGGGSSSSSRKCKKSNFEKPRQPQRGLGVAQLEKIRYAQMTGCAYLPPPPYNNLNYQEDMRVQAGAYSSSPSVSPSSSSSYGFQPMIGVGEGERSSIRYGQDTQPTAATPRWNPGNGIYDAQNFSEPSTTRHFLNTQEEDSLQKKRKKDRLRSKGTSSQSYDHNDTQELDLELRLSL